jgi:hypothetical protein
MMLTTAPKEFGIEPTDDFPRVYGAVMDWPVSKAVATVVGLCDGNASLYTTSTFGVIGGVGHESVRMAAKQFVTTAEKLFQDSVPTSDFSYPNPGRLKFYLLTFEGVRVIETDLDSMSSGKSKFSELGNDAQRLLTELRLTTEKK